MEGRVSKARLARSLGISRQVLYYHPRRPAKDEVLRERILATMVEHPAYGHRRIALTLGVNKKWVLRIMHLYHLRPQILRRGRTPRATGTPPSQGTPNLLRDRCPLQPDAIWVGDFTHLWFHGRWVYLATVMDSFTREIVAWQLGLYHTSQLILDVLIEAVRKRSHAPQLFHSDQGSEYTSHACVQWLVLQRIAPSKSPKGKPWTNGRQESFYASFRLEFGRPQAYPTVEALTEALGKYFHYYNTRRMHSALRMSPRQFYDAKRYPSS